MFRVTRNVAVQAVRPGHVVLDEGRSLTVDESHHRTSEVSLYCWPEGRSSGQRVGVHLKYDELVEVVPSSRDVVEVAETIRDQLLGGADVFEFTAAGQPWRLTWDEDWDPARGDGEKSAPDDTGAADAPDPDEEPF